MKKTKWLIYTFIVGLIPFIARSLVYLSMKELNWSSFLDPVDFIILGFVLCVANINELDTYKKQEDIFIVSSIGISTMLIFVFGVLFATNVLCSSIPDKVNRGSVLVISFLLSLATCIFSYGIYDRISKMDGGQTCN